MYTCFAFKLGRRCNKIRFYGSFLYNINTLCIVAVGCYCNYFVSAGAKVMVKNGVLEVVHDKQLADYCVVIKRVLFS
jgi:hypothetical protein